MNAAEQLEAFERPEKYTGEDYASLIEHNIGFRIPKGPTPLDLKRPYRSNWGVLVEGDVDGDIICEPGMGSIIIVEGGRACGLLEADKIIIMGSYISLASKRSVATGRILVSTSSDAEIDADLRSRGFAVHGTKVRGRLVTIEDGPQRLEG